MWVETHTCDDFRYSKKKGRLRADGDTSTTRKATKNCIHNRQKQIPKYIQSVMGETRVKATYDLT